MELLWSKPSIGRIEVNVIIVTHGEDLQEIKTMKSIRNSPSFVSYLVVFVLGVHVDVYSIGRFRHSNCLFNESPMMKIDRRHGDVSNERQRQKKQDRDGKRTKRLCPFGNLCPQSDSVCSIVFHIYSIVERRRLRKTVRDGS
jgi:hypothetical protein